MMMMSRMKMTLNAAEVMQMHSRRRTDECCAAGSHILLMATAARGMECSWQMISTVTKTPVAVTNSVQYTGALH
jgi:hypothetical protein